MNWIYGLRTIKKWKKYSQAHEECYIEHILQNIPQANTKHIVELGAWDGYHLSNTRYFIEQGYTALLIDGDSHGNEEVKEHFITKENVLDILESYKTPTYFDLLCLDLDGNDIYILNRILQAHVPALIVCEFNPIWKYDESYAIRYNPTHTWGNDDFYGFSFQAGLKLAKKFGYTCIHQNDNLNMYLVKNEILVESLNIPTYELTMHVPKVDYTQTRYHPVSNKTDWIIWWEGVE